MPLLSEERARNSKVATLPHPSGGRRFVKDRWKRNWHSNFSAFKSASKFVVSRASVSIIIIMSAPQSNAAEENPADPPAEDNEIKNGDAATSATSSVGETPSAPATPTKEVVTPPPATPSQPAQFVYDPNKITLKFIFANRDGVSVILECNPTDSIGEIKGALLSLWPEELPECSGGDKIRFICMGKGMLSPDTKTLLGADVPVFKTHPTPVNVAVKPENLDVGHKKGSPKKSNPRTAGGGGNNADGAGTGAPEPGSSGCSCVIL